MKKANAFDILILLLCAVIVYGAYLFSAPQQTLAQDGTLIRFTVELQEHPTGFYQRIQPGPIVFNSTNDTAIGTVVYAYNLPFLQDVPDEANSIIRRTPVEGREFTYVVIEAIANISDFEIEVNQNRIVVNRQIFVRSRDFAGLGFITHLEILN